MLLKKKNVVHWVGSAVVCATLATSGAAVAEPTATGSEQGNPHAEFLSLVSKLEKQVSAAKKQVFAAEGEVKKLGKRAETAGWRVAAARERFDDYQSRLSSVREQDKIAELKSKLSAERKLLQADAEKLSQIVNRSKETRAKSESIARELRTLKDDVAIEADRFEPNERGHKQALQLIADAEWALDKLQESSTALETDLETKATETLSKTAVD